jgi:hypothetical protein
MPEKSLLIQGIQNRRAEHPRGQAPLDRYTWQPDHYRRRRDLLGSASVNLESKGLAPEQRSDTIAERAVRTVLKPPSNGREALKALARKIGKRGA